ncbi:SGNH/GDSL hydrolase family protein [Stieleria sp. TO1_6]|uniref:SGNH/GDSL hydrolase family protein n=1 Tax=Stieleria tagensis TaxID=2956795 RepID=UPI00209B6EEC|nr:SGNH/GDSL hydrolase family protein [Stieleria tagensis]MCO8123481.1 SGNH/GDSL hydrolase family protein [Stieleria tagensis]
MKTTPCTIAILLACLAVPSAVAESPIKSGDRIAIVGNTFADQLRIHGYLETQLMQHWPDNPVSIRNLGWGGDMLTARDRPTGFPTEQETLTEHHTDVIVACFGMGESFSGAAGLSDFRDQVNAFIQSHAGKKYNGESDVRLILVSPIAHEQLGELTPGQEQRDQDLALYSKAMGDVAVAANVPFIDLYQPSRYLMDERQGPKLTTNGIHLNPYGYWAISHFFFRDLVRDDLDSIQGASIQGPWQMFIDAADLVTTTRAVDVSGLTRTDQGLAFRVTERVAPTLPPPSDQKLPPPLNHLRDSLTITHLQPGNYQLSVDGKPVTTASAQEWAGGVAIDQSPAHSAADGLRRSINDKNLQFTYSWKALNQVHIVGERKGSPSGRALPSEVIEFNKIANERDAKLRLGMQLQTRDWRLNRVLE